MSQALPPQSNTSNGKEIKFSYNNEFGFKGRCTNNGRQPVNILTTTHLPQLARNFKKAPLTRKETSVSEASLLKTH